jgi:hypothetical protein
MAISDFSQKSSLGFIYKSRRDGRLGTWHLTASSVDEDDENRIAFYFW